MSGNRKTSDCTKPPKGRETESCSLSPRLDLSVGRVEQAYSPIQVSGGESARSTLSPSTSPLRSIEQAYSLVQVSSGDSTRPTLSPSTSTLAISAIIHPVTEPDRVTTWAQEEKDSSSELQSPKSHFDICKSSNVELQIIVTRFEHLALRNYLLGSPAIDELLTLIPFNMYRALISNTEALGYDMEEIGPDNVVSRFCNTDRRDWKCPPSLRPTKIQREISHHPWLDLFPIPRMRDNMILAGDTLDEKELCAHLVGFTSPKADMGIVIWGEAWHPLCWEFTEAFVRNWRWVLEGCGDMLRLTNEMRVRRGEKPISL